MKVCAMPLIQHFQILFILTLVCRLSCLSLRSALSDHSKLVDLTHDFHEDLYHVSGQNYSVYTTNITAPGDPDWFILEEIRTPTHIGTHLDAPCFMDKSTWCPEAIPLERLILPAVVVDISKKVNGDPKVHLTPQDLKSWESQHGRIPDGSLLLIRTDWSKFWSDPLKYVGLESSGKLNYPSISGESAVWLANNRKIYGIGLDSFSLDIIGGEFLLHHVLLPLGVYGLENLKNLHMAPPTGAIAIVMPIKLKGLTGAPARVVLLNP